MIGAIKTLRELEIIAILFNHYRDGTNYSVSNLNGNNPTTNELKTQDPYQEKWGRLLTEYHNKERFKQQTK
ncbi:hypothetical protein I6945_03050 [Helicobacter pylori]|uniref:hypothetical protein n=1 Tax=Helicobacter pylori TaxID=210 RepID=UPI0018D148FE|nr:hypothetical protein [Helicobacter pylori]MBH0296057.1 hypothetical protein [Helicobacter pylori]